MRILMVSPFGYVRGGLERVMFDEAQWLRDAGHEVEYFATADRRNEPSRFAELFPTTHDYSRTGRPSFAAVRDVFWNKSAAAAFSSVLSDFGPDVVHSHGLGRHLSPSLLPEARSQHVPVVVTAHDYGLVCPGVAHASWWTGTVRAAGLRPPSIRRSRRPPLYPRIAAKERSWWGGSHLSGDAEAVPALPPNSHLSKPVRS